MKTLFTIALLFLTGCGMFGNADVKEPEHLDSVLPQEGKTQVEKETEINIAAKRILELQIGFKEYVKEVDKSKRLSLGGIECFAIPVTIVNSAIQAAEKREVNTAIEIKKIVDAKTVLSKNYEDREKAYKAETAQREAFNKQELDKEKKVSADWKSKYDQSEEEKNSYQKAVINWLTGICLIGMVASIISAIYFKSGNIACLAAGFFGSIIGIQILGATIKAVQKFGLLIGLLSLFGLGLFIYAMRRSTVREVKKITSE